MRSDKIDIQRVGDLEVAQDLSFERSAAKWRRVGWVLFLALLIAALLGLFGGAGVLSSTTQSGEGMRVEYEKFGRHNGPTELKIHMDANAASTDEVRLSINKEFLDAVKVERVEPEPDTVLTDDARQVFVFKLASAGAASQVVFHLMPQKLGSAHAQVGLDGRQPISFSHFTYP